MPTDADWKSVVASVLSTRLLLVLGAVLFVLACTGGVGFGSFSLRIPETAWRIVLGLTGLTFVVGDLYLASRQLIGTVPTAFGSTRKLKRFLYGFGNSDTVSVYLPLYPDTLVEPPVKEATSYRITAASLGDILAAERVLQVISPLGFTLTSEQVTIKRGVDLTEFSQCNSKLVFVLGGSASNKITKTLAKRADIETPVDNTEFVLRYKPRDKAVAISPSAEDRSEETAREQPSYGVIFRTNEKRGATSSRL